MKDDSEGNITTEFIALIPKTYSYFMNDGNRDKKTKETKKCVIKRILTFNHFIYCLLNKKTILQLQERFKSVAHNVYTQEINNIALRSNDDKMLQTFDRIISYTFWYKYSKSVQNRAIK